MGEEVDMATLNAVLQILSVGPACRTYARTRKLEATADPRPRDGGLVDITVHVQSRVPGIHPTVRITIQAMAEDGSGQVFAANFNTNGSALLCGLMPGKSYLLTASIRQEVS